MAKDTNNFTPKKIRNMIYGLDKKVTINGGGEVPAINFDNGATAPPFKNVIKKIKKEMLMYGSIGRGTGQKAQHSSEVYTEGRKTVLDFVGANNKEYTVFYVNSTTDGINKLASALIENHRDIILSTRMEHHANDLPWRERAHTVYLDVKEDGRLDIDNLEKILVKYEDRIKLVCVTAASNVTGYVNNVHEIAKIAHRHGAKIVVDGAQIVAHRKFSMLGATPDENIDFFVFSAHKMYSPFGGGAVVGLAEELSKHIPVFYGGGMVERVSDDDVIYTDIPDLYEAGSPNYPGVVGMLKAMENLQKIGFDYIVEHEQMLMKSALNRLKEIDGVILYGDNTDISDRVGTFVFNIDNRQNEDVAYNLAQHSAIAVRHAKFCAHPYVDRLLEFARAEYGSCINTGLVRVSFGIYNSIDEVNKLIDTIEGLQNGSIPWLYKENIVLAKFDARNASVYRTPNDRG